MLALIVSMIMAKMENFLTADSTNHSTQKACFVVFDHSTDFLGSKIRSSVLVPNSESADGMP